MDKTALNREGASPDLEYFVKECSMLNLAKVAYIQKVNPRLLDLVNSIMEGRPARNINKLLGEDLAHLRPMALCYDCDQDEIDRARAKFRYNKESMTFRPCQYFVKRGKCSKVERCDYLHMTRGSM